MKPNRYQELDALRGIAAIMIVLFHNTMARTETKWGITGVDLFFLISGFVIYMSITKVKASSEFIINRVSRLYPTYWACVTFTFILILIFGHQQPTGSNFIHYLANMTMFQYYFRIGDLDGPYWTMIIEMNFYIGILFLFHFKKLNYVYIIGIIFSVSAVIITSFFYHTFFAGIILRVCPLFTFIPLFLAGIIFYNIFENIGNSLINYTILLICLICQVLLFNYGGRSRVFVTQGEYIIMLILYFSLFILFVNGKLKFIVSKTTVFLGKISYPLYLVHQYLSVEVIGPILKSRFHLSFWLAPAIAAIPLSILIAFLISTYIEIPMNKWMKEKLRSIFYREPATVTIKSYNKD